MRASHRQYTGSFSTMWTCLILFLGLLRPAFAINKVQEILIPYTLANGETIYLAENRRPALYSGDYVDCLGTSQVDLSRFDVAYYKDNMTILFHLQGTTALNNQSLMLSIEIYAYGENRWTLLFDPCQVTAQGLCPMNSNVTIGANGLIPITETQANLIPDIALSIPDFEGQAILRMFSNNSRSEIACYAAVITNGKTFSHPSAAGTVLGVFTIVALLASFLMVVKCDSLDITRKLYAHSMSVLVVFEVFQSIYFTGALSVNWPSVLPAFWSNYAWTAGMIPVQAMQQSITRFAGSTIDGVTRVGAAAAGSPNNGIGGGYTLQSIYGRSIIDLDRSLTLHSRDVNATGYNWYGNLASAGLPVPGNYSGFAGTLAADGKITMSNAFLTGLIWFLIVLILVVFLIVLLKWTLEALSRLYLIEANRLPYFRAHWLAFVGEAVLRTTLIAFFALTFLSLFELSYGGSAGVMAVAAIVLVLVTFGMFGIATYVCITRLSKKRHKSSSQLTSLDNHPHESSPAFVANGSNVSDTNEINVKTPFWKIAIPEEGHSVHNDHTFTKTFGWLTARYKGSRWWFFLVWLIYQFVRACFLAGAISRSLVQVLGLLVVEILASAGMVYIRPYEGQRLNSLVVYLLGFAKVATTALAVTFDVTFNLPRIEATALGIIIIVVQGILTVVTLIAVIVGAFTSYLSLTRNRPDMPSGRLTGWRNRYFSHVDRMALEKPKTKLSRAEKKTMKEREKLHAHAMESERALPVLLPEPKPPIASGPYFKLGSVQRINKIEDDGNSSSEGEDEVQQLDLLFDKMPRSQRRGTTSSVASISSRRSGTGLPYGARKVPRRSWSTREYEDCVQEEGQAGETSSGRPLSAYPPISDASNLSVDHIHSQSATQIPLLPNIATSPYTLRSNLGQKETLAATRPAATSATMTHHNRPRSGTYHAVATEDSLEHSKVVVTTRPRSSTHEPSSSATYQDPFETALLAAQKANDRSVNLRSQATASGDE